MLPGIRFSILELLWLGATLSVSFGSFYRLAGGGGVLAWILSGLMVAFVARGTREGVSPGVRAAACMTAGGLGAMIATVVLFDSLPVHPLPVVAVALATGASYGFLLARRQVVAAGARPSWRDYVRLYVGSVLLATLFLISLPVLPSVPLRAAIGVVFGLLAATAISAAVYLGSRFSGTKEFVGQTPPDDAKEPAAAEGADDECR